MSIIIFLKKGFYVFVKHLRRAESFLDRDTWPSLRNKHCQEYRRRTKQPFSFLVSSASFYSSSFSFSSLLYNKILSPDFFSLFFSPFPRFLSEGRLCIFRAFKNRRFAVSQTGQRSVTPWAQDCAKIAGKTEKNSFLLPESSLVDNFRYAASSAIESVVDPHLHDF